MIPFILSYGFSPQGYARHPALACGIQSWFIADLFLFQIFLALRLRKYRRQTNLEGLVYMYRGRTLAFSALISSELFSPAEALAKAGLRDE
jgi:hypothetical protein